MNIAVRLMCRLSEQLNKAVAAAGVVQPFTRAYSQEGEDVILLRLFQELEDGFYVDVGAHHPHRFSNTQLLYERGWHGINVDATPGSMSAFQKLRPRDINIEAAVGPAGEGPRTFYAFNEGALNSFDEDLSRRRLDNPYGHAITGEYQISFVPLADLLNEHLPSGIGINVMTVDVEGYDLQVLGSNDWGRFRPQYVLAECYGVLPRDLPQDRVYTFLGSQGYDFFAKTVNTVFFRDRSTSMSESSHANK